VQKGHAGLLPRCRAGPQTVRWVAKRLLRLPSLGSTRSWERLLAALPEMQRALDRVLRAKRFDFVNLEFSYLGECDLGQASPNGRLPRLLVDSHNIDYEPASVPIQTSDSVIRSWPGLTRPSTDRSSLAGFRGCPDQVRARTNKRKLNRLNESVHKAICPRRR
jgi:hypothetical protein